MLALFTDGWSLQAIAAINAVLAWAAACVHAWAAYKTSGLLRKMFLSIAGLATFYSFAYWWLFFNPTEGGAWSDFLRPFGIFTWVIAWAIEPVVLVTYLNRRGQQIVDLAHKRAVEAEGRLSRE